MSKRHRKQPKESLMAKYETWAKNKVILDYNLKYKINIYKLILI